MLIAKSTLVQTENGYKYIEDWNGEKILTEQGFQNLNVEEVSYTGPAVRIIMWGYTDHILLSNRDFTFGVRGLRCRDLGCKGFNICKPYRRCWDNCPDNHPNKKMFINPCEFSVTKATKVSQLLTIPKYSKYDYNKKIMNRTNEHKKYYDEGFLFGCIYDDKTMIPENNIILDASDINNVDIYTDKYAEYLISKKKKDIINNNEHYVLYNANRNININKFINNNPEYFIEFMHGWQAQMKDTKLDSWNYYTIINNKECAYNVQFLFNYFGIPCAMIPYQSQKFGEDKWAVTWCKNKKEFFYKILNYNDCMYNQVKKWTPYTHIDCNWYKITNSDSTNCKYAMTPMLFRIN